MCAVSMVTQHYYDKYPNPSTFPEWKFGDYFELVRKAKLYDELTGQKDCPEPVKQQWHDAVYNRMYDSTVNRNK